MSRLVDQEARLQLAHGQQVNDQFARDRLAQSVPAASDQLAWLQSASTERRD